MKELNFDMFVELLGSSARTNNIKLDRPMIINFYASWCPVCQEVMEIVEKIEKDYSGVDSFCVDTDEDILLSSFFSIVSLPTIVLFVNGEKPILHKGRQSEQELREMFETTIESHYKTNNS